MRFRPLDRWPESTPLGVEDSRFRVNWSRTLSHLTAELERVEAREVLIEAGFTVAQIRNDGWPRGSAEPAHPGVILYFRTQDGPLRFPCGTFADWRDNLRAIALTLEALRAIDRYGVTMGHQQYAGFKALPAAVPLREAAELLATLADVPVQPILNDWNAYREAYRVSARLTHPDMAGGNRERFDAVAAASQALAEMHRQAGRSA